VVFVITHEMFKDLILADELNSIEKDTAYKMLSAEPNNFYS